MRSLFTIAAGSVLILIGCGETVKKTGTSTITVTASAKDSFFKAATYIDTSGEGKHFRADGMEAIIIPEMMGDIEEMQDMLPGDGPVGFVLPCQCAFKNDTLLVMTGIAYEGGLAYMGIVKKDHSKTMVTVFGKERKWKLEDKEFNDQIEITSKKDAMTLSKKFPPKIEDALFGIFEIETPLFYELEDTVATRQMHKVKIYFSCKVYPEIY